MPISYTDTAATLTDIVTVEDAEPLLTWLQANPDGELDLAGLTHLHAANLQVLMAAKPKISAWPQDDSLSLWLSRSLKDGE